MGTFVQIPRSTHSSQSNASRERDEDHATKIPKSAFVQCTGVLDPDILPPLLKLILLSDAIIDLWR